MDPTRVPGALQERLGPEATSGLVHLFEQARVEWTANVVTQSIERFERRLVEELAAVRVDMARSEARVREEIAHQGAALRTEMTDRLAILRELIAQQGATIGQEIAVNRFELLKWSFLFWIGHVFAVVGLIGVMFRVM